MLYCPSIEIAADQNLELLNSCQSYYFAFQIVQTKTMQWVGRHPTSNPLAWVLEGILIVNSSQHGGGGGGGGWWGIENTIIRRVFVVLNAVSLKSIWTAGARHVLVYISLLNTMNEVAILCRDRSCHTFRLALDLQLHSDIMRYPWSNSHKHPQKPTNNT